MKGDKAISKANLLFSKLNSGYSSLSANQRVRLYNEGIALLRYAAYSGNSVGQYEYAFNYYESNNFFTLDNPNYNPAKLVYWYTKACIGGIGDAYNSLAYLYETGKGCSRNLKKALALYKKASELSNELGKANYRIMLRQMSKNGRYGKQHKLFVTNQY